MPSTYPSPDVPLAFNQQPRTTVRWKDPALLDRVTEYADALDRSVNWVIQDAVKFFLDEMARRDAEGLAAARKALRGQGRPMAEVFQEIDAKRAAELPPRMNDEPEEPAELRDEIREPGPRAWT